MNKKSTRLQAALYVVFGGTQYVLDAALHYFLLVLGVDIYAANLTSRGIVGVSGFFANRLVTFSGTPTRLGPSFLRFIVAWMCASTLSTLGTMAALSLIPQGREVPELGLVIKLMVEGMVVVPAFLMQKFWTFRH